MSFRVRRERCLLLPSRDEPWPLPAPIGSSSSQKSSNTLASPCSPRRPRRPRRLFRGIGDAVDDDWLIVGVGIMNNEY